MLERADKLIGFSSRRRDERIASVAGLDPTTIGDPISRGAEYRVYHCHSPDIMDGRAAVVKIPTVAKSALYHTSVTEDLSTLDRFFPGLAAETQVLSPGQDEVIVQEFIDGGIPHIDDEFFDLLREHAPANQYVYHEHGLSIDLFKIAARLRRNITSGPADNFMRRAASSQTVLTDISLLHLHRGEDPGYAQRGMKHFVQGVIHFQSHYINKRIGIQLI